MSKQTHTKTRDKSHSTAKKPRPMALPAMLDRITAAALRANTPISRATALEIAASARGHRNSHEFTAAARTEHLDIKTLTPHETLQITGGQKTMAIFRDPDTNESFGIESATSPILATTPSGALVLLNREPAHGSPRKTTELHIALVEHRHGVNTYTAFSLAELYEKLAEYCISSWEELPAASPDSVEFSSDREMVEHYFENHGGENLDITSDSITTSANDTPKPKPPTVSEIVQKLKSWDKPLPFSDPCLDVSTADHNPSTRVIIEVWKNNDAIPVGEYEIDTRRFILTSSYADIVQHYLPENEQHDTEASDLLIKTLIHDNAVHIGPSYLNLDETDLFKYINGELSRIAPTHFQISDKDDFTEEALHLVQSDPANQALLAALNAVEDELNTEATKDMIRRAISGDEEAGASAILSLFT